MSNNDNKKSHFLITALFPEGTDFVSDVNSELIIQQEMSKLMYNLVQRGIIAHYAIARDDVISDKLKA